MSYKALNEGIQFMEKAQQEAKNENHEQAINLLEKGTQHFIHSIEYETQGSESKKKITEKLDQYKKSIKSLIPSDFILSENEKDSKNYAVNESEKIVDECEDEQFSVSSEQLEYNRPETVDKLQRDLNDDKQCKCIVYLVLGLLIILFFIGIYFSLFFNY